MLAEKYWDRMDELEKEKPELVAIATESGEHAKIALDCLDAGCNVIIEKPIALSLEDADKIVAKAKEKGLVVCANHQNRFNKSIQKIRKSVENVHSSIILTDFPPAFTVEKNR